MGLLKKYPTITRAISCTTRAPRLGEIDGIDYYFLSKETFQEKIQTHQFLESATVYDNYYGTLTSEVFKHLKTNKDVLLNIDVQGAASIRNQAKKDPDLNAALVTFFVTPSRLSDLKFRLVNRAKDSEEIIHKRLREARNEIKQAGCFDYQIYSQSKSEDLRKLEVIIEAEKLRRQQIFSFEDE